MSYRATAITYCWLLNRRKVDVQEPEAGIGVALLTITPSDLSLVPLDMFLYLLLACPAWVYFQSHDVVPLGQAVHTLLGAFYLQRAEGA